jgi:predicted amidohydrolase
MPEVRENIRRATQFMQACLAKADSQQIDLLCFPECYLQGYLTDSSAAWKHAISLNSSAFSDLLARLLRHEFP